MGLRSTRYIMRAGRGGAGGYIYWWRFCFAGAFAIVVGFESHRTSLGLGETATSFSVYGNRYTYGVQVHLAVYGGHPTHYRECQHGLKVLLENNNDYITRRGGVSAVIFYILAGSLRYNLSRMFAKKCRRWKKVRKFISHPPARPHRSCESYW